ncbi:hypothetical protein AAG570_010913 [Ranatra chinensis]|uniref:Uncharacterized protein n=1 Tax=Ranatra chinensis TaxID=642074 RepID=A0ABD0YJ46_9HEMI
MRLFNTGPARKPFLHCLLHVLIVEKTFRTREFILFGENLQAMLEELPEESAAEEVLRGQRRVCGRVTTMAAVSSSGHRWRVASSGPSQAVPTCGSAGFFSAHRRNKRHNVRLALSALGL